MGNEMGNSNTSGLQEEENGATQVEGKSVQEAGHINGAEVENHIVSVAEGKDYRQKENGLASDVPNGETDPEIANQISDGGVEEETEVQSPDESPKVQMKSISEASDESSEIQPNSASNDSKDHEKPPVNADGEASDDSSETQPNSVSNDSKDHEKPAVNADGEASDDSSETQPNSLSNDSKDHEKSPVSTDVEGENHIPVAEGKDYNSKEINGFFSDVPKEAGDPHILNQISDEREQEEIEVLSPAESPKSEVESNNAGSETSDIQPTSPSKHSKDHEIIPQVSNLEENMPRISSDQLEKQTSMKKEEDGTKTSSSETISSSHDPDPQKVDDWKFYRPELGKIHTDPPVQDCNESLHIHEDIPRANLNCTREENGRRVDSKILKNMDETVGSGSNLDVEMAKSNFTLQEVTSEEVFYEDRLEIKDGNGIGNGFNEKPMIKFDSANGGGVKCNGERPIEICPISTTSPKAGPEVTSMNESLNHHPEVSESADNCVVLAAETILIEKESEHGEDKPNYCPTQSSEESVKESKTGSANLSESEFLMTENNQKRDADITCDGDNEDCIEVEEFAENGHQVDEHINDQIEASVEHSKDSQKEAEIVVESERVLTESSLTDCKREEVSEERQIFEEMEEKTNASYGIGNDTEVRESGEQCLYPTLPVGEEVFLPGAALCVVEPEGNEQNNEMQSRNIQSRNHSISELKQESYGDILDTELSCFDSKNLMAETSDSVAESAIEKPRQDLSNHTAKTMMVVIESGTQVNHLYEECAKVEMPAFANDDYQAQDSAGRFSTESNPNNSNSHSQMQKSPSFGIDLRIEARTEESDRTPLLYQDKTAIEDFSTEADVILGNPIAHTQHDQKTFEYQAMPEPVEEKVVRMERSESEKSKTPFLGFLKEEEEAHMTVTPQKHNNNTAAKKANKESLNLLTKEVASTSPKSKEKRKPRSSLFTNCMCCTTVIN